MKATVEYCPTHEDVPMLTRSTGSVNGGYVRWGCAICNMIEVEKLRHELDRVNGNSVASGESVERFRARDRLAQRRSAEDR